MNEANKQYGNVEILPEGQGRFTITFDMMVYTDRVDRFIRAAFFKGQVYLSIIDLCRCLGFKAPSKIAQRFTCAKVKLDIKTMGGRTCGMWFFDLDDAVEFVTNHTTDYHKAFRKWFVNELVPELRNKGESLSTQTGPFHIDVTRDVHFLPEAPAMPEDGVNIPSNISAKIDQLIIELLTLKQELA